MKNAKVSLVNAAVLVAEPDLGIIRHANPLYFEVCSFKHRNRVLDPIGGIAVREPFALLLVEASFFLGDWCAPD